MTRSIRFNNLIESLSKERFAQEHDKETKELFDQIESWLEEGNSGYYEHKREGSCIKITIPILMEPIVVLRNAYDQIIARYRDATELIFFPDESCNTPKKRRWHACLEGLFYSKAFVPPSSDMFFSALIRLLHKTLLP